MIENADPHDRPDLADEVLETVDNVCKELGLTYFLFGGTCLGLYRDGTYVSDNDLDIALVGSKEWYHVLWTKLASLPGWTDAYGLRKGPIQLDLHYTDDELPYYVIPSWRPMPYIFQYFDIVSYHGRDYKVPGPVEEYLKWEFGPDWRKPVSREIWSMVDTILQTLLLEDTDG